MELHDIREFAIHELERLYGAHQLLLDRLPEAREMASLPYLQECFDDQLEDARAHDGQFQELFNQLGAQLRAADDPAFEYILAELDDIEADKSSPAVVDAKLIDVGRKVNLYLEAGYGTMSDVAEQMRMPKLGQILHDRLHETDQAAEKLLNAVPDVVFV